MSISIPSDSAISPEPMRLVHPAQLTSTQIWDNCSFLRICHSPSHETRDYFVSLYPVEPGGAHAVVNWSFSIWQNNQGGLARLLPPGFPATGSPLPPVRKITALCQVSASEFPVWIPSSEGEEGMVKP